MLKANNDHAWAQARQLTVKYNFYTIFLRAILNFATPNQSLPEQCIKLTNL